MTTKNIYKVWLGDGSMSDGATFKEFSDAVAAIEARYGWDEAVTIENCDGSSWSVYETQDDADADEDGAYAAGVREIGEDE